MRKGTKSVAPRVDWLKRKSKEGFVPDRRDIKLTTPPIAPEPYKAEATPFITSTWPKSIGGICKKPRPPTCSPNNGRPSAKKRVYRPFIPRMRTLAAPKEGDVCCTRRPPISFNI